MALQSRPPFEDASHVSDKVFVPPVPEDRIGARVTEIDVLAMIAVDVRFEELVHRNGVTPSSFPTESTSLVFVR